MYGDQGMYCFGGFIAVLVPTRLLSAQLQETSGVAIHKQVRRGGSTIGREVKHT